MEFTPGLGRIRDVGRGGSVRFSKQVRRAVARLNRNGQGTKFSGRQIGRGNGALPLARRRLRSLPRHSMRRVIVKVHIARAGNGSGRKAFRQHLYYLQRDGVEHDGAGGELYDREHERIDDRAFVASAKDDRHQFRLIVSPEDGVKIDDLKTSTRALMREVERDLGTRLDWVAVDHHDTGHPHTHIVVRGKDTMGKDLVIARDYLMRGVRGRAEQVVTDLLGPRRDLDILRARHSEIAQDRMTGLDREIARLETDGRFVMPDAEGSRARFTRSLQLQRLRHLEGLHLADQESASVWRMKPGWPETLQALGRRGDIIRSLSAAAGRERSLSDLHLFSDRDPLSAPLMGQIIGQGPEDELRDTRFLLVEGFGGGLWHVPAGSVEASAIPPKGAIVEVGISPGRPRPADKVIARIAERYGGHYSDALHAEADPSASAAYRLAHKRRLEALRRVNIVRRRADGVWEIGKDYLEKAGRHETRRDGGVSLRVRSWLAMEAQIEVRGLTWLDEASSAANADADYSNFDKACRDRIAFLRREGYLGEGESTLSDQARRNLRAQELWRTADAETKRSGRTHLALSDGVTLDGKFEKTIDLGQGRFAIIGNERAFALVPWRDELARHRGAALVIEQRTGRVNWTFPGGRSRSLSR